MKSRTAIIPLACAMLMALQGCYYDVEDELYPGNCQPITPSWSTSVAPLVAERCSGSSCHGAGSQQVQVTNYAQVKALVDNGKFVDRVLVLRDMPDGSSLNKCQLDMLQAWVDAGAPNN